MRIKHNIKTLTDQESRDYIEHRLKLVGSNSSEVFTPRAISAITNYAKGIPRVINIVCDNAFLNGFSKSKRKIDAKIIREVIMNLEGPASRKIVLTRIFRSMKRQHPIRGEKNFSPKRIFSYTLLSLLSLGGIFFLLYGLLLYGPSNQHRIESLWSSLFHTAPFLITPPQTTTAKTSKGDIHYPPVEIGAVPIESPQPVVPPSTSSIALSAETISTETTIVRKGQSISRLSQKYYGMSNLTLADLILDSNPEITNAHRISVNQEIKIPKITEGSLIVQSSDRTYGIHVGTFWSPEFARLYRGELSLKGKDIEILAIKATPKETWYRVVVGKYTRKDEVLKVISLLKERNLLPIFGATPKLK
jgi:general secretion pathway protein A